MHKKEKNVEKKKKKKKKKKTKKKCVENYKKVPKVIHIEKCGNIEKKELYTKLYTLSTEKRRKI